jgi:GMP synthase (glutamine-hydrolysing)
MRKLLVFQHVPFEILGTLNPLLKNAGFRIRYVNFGREPDARPSLDGYAGLIVLGGPMSVNDAARHRHLTTEMTVIGEALARDMPILGICLGAQLLAATLGARVRRSPHREIGWHDVAPTAAGRRDALLGGFGASERLFQWHSDTFDLPAGAEHLATSPRCEAQAFRYGRSASGVQFHLVVDEPLIERWLRVPVHREELAAEAGRVSPEAIRAETPQRIARSTALSERVFGAFVDLFGLPPKRRALPSR